MRLCKNCQNENIWNWDEKNQARHVLYDEHDNIVSFQDMRIIEKNIVEHINYRCLVFLLCRNTIGSVVGYASFIKNGIVPLLVNHDMDSDLLYNLISKYKPDYLWVPNSKISLFPKYESQYSVYDYTLLRTGYNGLYEIHGDLALLLTTSGSTGSPKFVRQSYTNMIENARAIIKYLDIDSSERPITTLPMNYTYGLSIINTHLMVGATILLTEKTLMQKEFWQFFKEQGATSIAGVPYTYEMLDKLRFHRMDLPSLKTMTQAGGKLTPELHEKFAKYAEETGRKFVVMYGQCEATARMGYLPPEKAVEKKGSMGIAIPGGKFKLLDGDGEEITTPHTTGELIYEGENVTLGYAECAEDLAKGDERHGVLATGDMAQFDEDGYYYIVGRKKRFLKIYGNRVNLDEVERLIKGEFDIDVASGGIDDHLYVFITDDRHSSKIKDFIVDKTKLNPAAYKVVVLSKIPRNESGKTLYKDLEKYYV